MKLLAALASVVALMAVRGWAIATLWAWFIVPLGVRPIGFAWGYGLTCLGAILSDTVAIKKHWAGTDEPAWMTTVVQMLVPPVIVLFGWFAKLAMP